MLTIKDARLEVRKPGSETTDFKIPVEDIQGVDHSMRIGKRKDSGNIALSNDEGQYSDENEITSGDELRFWVTMADYIVEWGERSWGDGAWGGERDRWTAMVRDREFEYISPGISNLKITCEDFVFSVASKRTVFNSYEDTQISGTSDSLLESLIDNNAAEIGKDRIDEISATTSMTIDGTKLHDVFNEIADRADAVMSQRRNDLIFKEVSSITPKFDLLGTEIGRLSTRETDTGLVNEVRVDGGESHSVDDEQPTQDTYTTVTSDNRATFQVSTRKSAISRIEIWTRSTGSEESVTVRIQKDDGGAPVDVTDTSSDIDSVTYDHRFVSNDDFTTFILNEHTLPEPNPWIIVETDGSEGQDIGTDSSGNVAYRSYYSFDITVREVSRSSINKYRRREGRINADAVSSVKEANDIAHARLDHDSVPEHTVQAEADSSRVHQLVPADVVTLDFPREKAVGDYIVTERSDTYDGSLLETTITLQEVSSL